MLLGWYPFAENNSQRKTWGGEGENNINFQDFNITRAQHSCSKAKTQKPKVYPFIHQIQHEAQNSEIMIGKNETIKSIKVHNIWGKYEIFSLFYYMFHQLLALILCSKFLFYSVKLFVFDKAKAPGERSIYLILPLSTYIYTYFFSHGAILYLFYICLHIPPFYA